MEVSKWKLHHGRYLMERTPWKLHQELTPWKLPSGAYTIDVISWNVHHVWYMMERTRW